MHRQEWKPNPPHHPGHRRRPWPPAPFRAASAPAALGHPYRRPHREQPLQPVSSPWPPPLPSPPRPPVPPVPGTHSAGCWRERRCCQIALHSASGCATCASLTPHRRELLLPPVVGTGVSHRCGPPTLGDTATLAARASSTITCAGRTAGAAFDTNPRHPSSPRSCPRQQRASPFDRRHHCWRCPSRLFAAGARSAHGTGSEPAPVPAVRPAPASPPAPPAPPAYPAVDPRCRPASPPRPPVPLLPLVPPVPEFRRCLCRTTCATCATCATAEAGVARAARAGSLCRSRGAAVTTDTASRHYRCCRQYR